MALVVSTHETRLMKSINNLKKEMFEKLEELAKNNTKITTTNQMLAKWLLIVSAVVLSAFVFKNPVICALVAIFVTFAFF